uniref:S-adenosyl-L-methionine-dependent Diels-Alderase iliD n=1 Tax=Neonectria sp. (strain DH2) TaxID=1735992 RepID=ILID_NEOS2|nr:RecName: Full=S-adenosyl-L-methionine-dependent Diels-Alderase iliD; AltName: Full=C-methyltransferase iliD; AltName: Full=Ilicicolin H biosynthesis cluster protein D; AltName: Full=Pericyclase iliD [Neonectria sp. DH2]
MTSTEAAGTGKAPAIRANPALQTYYESQESYLVYEVVLRGSHHFGFYEKDTYWPFPVGRSLERMEAKLLSALALPSGSQILDAGCGFGPVAISMAKKGMRVTAIDIIDHHVTKARRNVEKAGLPKGQVTVEKMDYQHLESIASESHDDAKAAATGFFRILKPGGRIAFFEAQRSRTSGDYDEGDELAGHLKLVNEYTAMPTNELSREDYFKDLLEDAGFVDVEFTLPPGTREPREHWSYSALKA